MKKAKNITWNVKWPEWEAGEGEYRDLFAKLQQTGMSWKTAERIMRGQTNVSLGSLVRVMAALELDSLDDLLNIEWE